MPGNGVLFVGHSLVGPTMPQMLTRLLADRTVDRQVINGAPLSYNWNNGASAEGVNARQALTTDKYNVLIMTEAIPLATHLRWSDTYGVATRYANLAWQANASTRVMIYETWHSVENGNYAGWRQQITSDRSAWQGIVNHLARVNPAGTPEPALVPAGQAMGRLYDAITAGQAVTIGSMSRMFSDDIHLTDTGNYFISMVQYAAITLDSPVGKQTTIRGDWGQSFTGWNYDEAVLLQHIAWETVALSGQFTLPAGVIRPQLINGSSGANVLNGGGGDDRIYGNQGNDTIFGGPGQDMLFGGTGNDLIEGGRGNDVMFGGVGNDTLRANSGNDTLRGGTGDDVLEGHDNNDVLYGEAGNDRLFGGNGTDHLYGGDGNDSLYGRAHADQLFGGAGNDLLEGGTGADTLNGGAGRDRFVFMDGHGRDTITDLTAAQGDRLMLDDALWSGTLTAAQVVSRFGQVSGGNVVLNFGDGDVVTITNLSSLNGLAGMIDIF